jgi:pimeloyl-ACP methyl ester carboxylesterase
MRALEPDVIGAVERSGARVAFEVCGDGDPAVFLIPPSTITHSRSWKGQIPFLARRCQVLTTDGRGTGHSDRCAVAARHAPDEVVADLCAVLDAARVDRAVVVAHCHAIGWALRLAVAHSERVTGFVAISPGVALTPDYEHNTEGARRWADTLEHPTGWAMRNREFWRRDGGYPAWIEFFFHELFPEPHSTKPYEDAVSWALDTDAEAMIAEREGRAAPSPAEAEELCRRLRCPVLVIHGTDDRCQPLARALRMAELTGGELLLIEGAGHLPHARDPVKVNLAIAEFARRIQVDSVVSPIWS